MTVTQENLIQEIAQAEGMDAATVRKLFQSLERHVFDHLSSATACEPVVIKLLDGLRLECNYVPEKEMHTFDDIVRKAKIWVKPKITRYYNRKLNEVHGNESV